MKKAVASLLLLSSCGRYADFGLPSPTGPKPSLDIRWESTPRPVLARGPETWDSVDTLNPSVIERDGQLWNLYSGFDGNTWHTGLATSKDGLAWTKLGRAISPEAWEGNYIAANGSARFDKGEFLYWYQAADPPVIALARSQDGRAWLKHGLQVLPVGPRGSWDERGVADPYVIREGEWLYMIYLGQDRARRQRLGLARSRAGAEWEKSRVNPILELGEAGSFDENGLGEPAIWQAHGRWWMLYTGRDRSEARRLGLAYSDDGRAWKRYSDAAIFAGDQDWNRKVVCDPTILPASNGVRVWYGGGDIAHPAERIHGQIGYGFLRMEVR